MIFWRRRKGTIIEISPFFGRQLCVFFLEALLALFRGNHNGGVGVMIRLSSALFFFSQRITIDGCLVCNSAGDWVPETRFLGFGSVVVGLQSYFIIFESGSRLYETLKNHLIWHKFGLKSHFNLISGKCEPENSISSLGIESITTL